MAYDLGVQSFTYRTFTVEAFCDALAGTGVTAVELCHEHVTPASDPEEVDSVAGRLDDAGLDVCGYGVERVSDLATARETLDLVEQLGGEYASIELPPDDEALASDVAAAADAYDVDLAIHNHGPGATFDAVEDVLAVLEATPHDRLGACVDTGHFLRSSQPPGEVVPRLGDRVHAVHLKDFVDVDTEAVPGQGALDVPELLSLLDEHTSFDRPLVVEYEADPEDPTPAVEQAVAAVRDAE